MKSTGNLEVTSYPTIINMTSTLFYLFYLLGIFTNFLLLALWAVIRAEKLVNEAFASGLTVLLSGGLLC